MRNGEQFVRTAAVSEPQHAVKRGRGKRIAFALIICVVITAPLVVLLAWNGLSSWASYLGFSFPSQKEVLPQGQQLVNQVYAFRQEKGRWPNSLDEVAAGRSGAERAARNTDRSLWFYQSWKNDKGEYFSLMREAGPHFPSHMEFLVFYGEYNLEKKQLFGWGSDGFACPDGVRRRTGYEPP